VRDIAKSSETGRRRTYISGFAVGLEATAIPAVVVSIAILFSFWLGESTGIPGGGIYGTAIATMGMLATAAYILAMDTFGPIVDNGAGIIEMAACRGRPQEHGQARRGGQHDEGPHQGVRGGKRRPRGIPPVHAFLSEARVKASISPIPRRSLADSWEPPSCSSSLRSRFRAVGPRSLVHHQGRKGSVPREPGNHGGQP